MALALGRRDAPNFQRLWRQRAACLPQTNTNSWLLVQVRHTWQLDPSGFRLSNRKWQKAVDKGGWLWGVVPVPFTGICSCSCNLPTAATCVLSTFPKTSTTCPSRCRSGCTVLRRAGSDRHGG